jgi:tetratricopeptide (TPR) repeat protein
MNFSEKINELFKRKKWAEARRLLEGRLHEEPANHWLLTRLGTTYYEQRNYDKALALTRRAYALAPHCPLVAWDLASSLEMLGKDREALRIYQELLARGPRSIADEECGEGLAWARSLLTDCLYSVAGCLHRRGRHHEALRAIQQYLQLRAMGVRSVYTLKEGRARLQEISGATRAAFIEQEIGESGRRLAKVVG